MKTNLTTLLLVCFISTLTFAQDWKTYPYIPTGSLVSFPTDEGFHSEEPTEWWYANGEVTGVTSGKTYTYLLIYFSSSYSYAGYDGFRILNIMDESTGQLYSDTKPVNYDSKSETELLVEANVFLGSQDTWITKRDTDGNLIPFEYTISATSSFGALQLDYKTTKRPLLIGDDGYLEQGSENYTYYYSQTTNEVSGNITLNGTTEAVTGTSWIDRQYGSFNPYLGENYEWFSIQLSNGMDINAYNVFTPDYAIPDNLKYKVFAAYVDETTQYTTSDFVLERLSYHWSDDNVQCYSNKWRLTSDKNKVDLIITPRHNDAEILEPIRFFEDATTITGSVNGVEVTGIGFAELIHAYEHPIVTFNAFEDEYFTPNTTISWELTNPDDGRTTYYDVLYSTDNTNYSALATDLTATSFSWDASTLENGDTVWFKIMAHSSDNVLKSETVSAALQFNLLTVSDAVFSDIRLYPNPTKNQLFLKGLVQLKTLDYQIIDISGRIVSKASQDLNTADVLEINTQQLGAGLYFLKCITAEAEQSYKFVKK